ncbi:glycosyltransferase family 4 protein [Tenacibaculum finnmarkense]|uniref:Glycosyl transferase family 1 n=2 Tax=Tenacibaculum finnmarkense TaxID=2781243 RepID=A0A2I2M712_9FLAO|nr:glycosyltransferase family 4 protein [Tenacibaculum finnmarkense]MCD8417460.1 glycosyltransferase family 4 protein [Tenacibaculum finnmarkense genomovar finnmarkense]MCD8427239.1 glycosyltransferase family 4 protein [Tenacibaculum finnmarkense genomovar finnmarkense]MCD8430730.1 glycosyltransferase family 4 protein [Tenacibaculum finnmarkense genomovar ulcerans]SOU88331.1 Glycosyl transferase family 1 [Tenacibaculum finnmarkense genomovar ulcerans]
MKNKKIVRITTVPQSLKTLLKGQHKFMSQNGFEVVGVSSEGKYLQDVADDEGIRVKVIEMTRKITPLKDLKSLWELYRLLKKERPFIVHTHTPKAGIIGMLASYLANVPNRLHTVAGLPLLEAKGVKRTILNFVEKLTYKCATRVYPNSNGLKDIILENKFIASEKLNVIANGSSNGIDTAHFNSELFSKEKQQRLKTTLKIKEDDFVFIFVGRIVGDKGINELIKAFDKLSKTKYKIKLLLVGSFEDELDPLQEVTKNIINTNKQIISVGYQNDVRPYFSIADVLTFPSYREGFPNVVMQAGAMGLPSIVSNINGCNEIIEENINGFIVPVKNSDALYEAMLKMMLNSDMKLKAREMIATRFEQKVVWDALLNEYKTLY